MQKTPPSNEALQEITRALEKALAAPQEKVIAVAAFCLIEGPGGPETVRGQWAIYPDPLTTGLLRQVRLEANRILGDEA